MLLPIHFVKTLLSNGVIFENESGASPDMARRIATKCQLLSEALAKDYPQFRDKKPSELGSAIVYAARKEENSL